MLEGGTNWQQRRTRPGIRRKGEKQMATTAIWDVTDRLKRVLDYARNPDKTAHDRAETDSLQQALGYATADAKTE